MYPYIFYIAGNSPASRAAGHALIQSGITVSPLPNKDVTHLLLPIPSLDDAGNIRGVGSVSGLLEQLSSDVTIIGGNLKHPVLDNASCIDLLKDPIYLAENASITAYCALRLILMELPCILKNCPVLIVGWGRIAQCLAQLLKSAGANITIAARKTESRAIASALGYNVCEINNLQTGDYRVIINTAPAPDIIKEQDCNTDCLKIDLASIKGIQGKHVILARGLPGKDAPETTGKLIVKRTLALIQEEAV